MKKVRNASRKKLEHLLPKQVEHNNALNLEQDRHFVQRLTSHSKV
jgi:hypothetical protein